MLSHTSTQWAPWYVIPADRKWFARIGAGAVIAQAWIDIDPRVPDARRRCGPRSRRQRPSSSPRHPTGRLRIPSKSRRHAHRSGLSPRQSAERWPPGSWPPSITARRAPAAFSSISTAHPRRSRHRSKPCTTRGPVGWRSTWGRSGTEPKSASTRRSARPAPRPRTSPRSGSPTSSRNGGSWDRRTGRPVAARDHLAGHQDGRRRRRACRRRGHPAPARSHRPADLDVLLATQDGSSTTRTRPRGRRPTAGTSSSAHRTPGCSGISPAAPTAGCTQRIRRTQAGPS